MGTLVYGLSTSLDGYVTGPDGTIDWTVPDEETSRFVNARESRVGTYLLGRRMYETMRVWEDDSFLVGLPDFIVEYVPIWRAAEKVVYSTTLEDPGRPRTRVERRLDPDAVRALKESTTADVGVAGAALAAGMLRAGLVDELTLLVLPVVVGGGTRFLPAGLGLSLELTEVQRFGSGAVFLRYAIKG
ncbi:MAG: dihydrofolate reductase family protein [Propionicimonas sp.]|nr:dihydrofolate reductase family protein [Propionicimonas sp.]